MLDTETGSVTAEIDALTDQNELAQDRIDEILRRLEQQREDLLRRFIRMEEALSTINSTLNAIQQQFAALDNSNNGS